MVEAEKLDENGFPVGRTRRAPARTRSRQSPRRAKSTAENLEALSRSPTRSDSGDSRCRKMKGDLLAMQTALHQSDGNLSFHDNGEEEDDHHPDSPKTRSRPRRARSANQSSSQDELLEMAKAEAAKKGAKVKVIVRRKKRDDASASPTGVRNNRRLKVPAGSLDFANFEGDMAQAAGAFNPNNIEKNLEHRPSRSTKESSDKPRRGRDVLHREGRARSRSRARRSTRSRSRGRMTSHRINLDETNSDSEVEEDEDEEAEDEIDVVDDILQNRGEGGGGLSQPSPGKTKNRFGLSMKKEGPPVTAPLLIRTSSGKMVAPDGQRSAGNSPVRTRERFTDASEWSGVVEDLIQKRHAAKEKEAEPVETKPKGLGRLFVARK